MKNSFDSFFKENEEFLSKNYPGLRSLRLLQDFEECDSLSIDEFKEKVLQGIPLEYISNTAHFYRSSFYVDQSVLIPRSETEILVEDSINYIKRNNVKSVYEVGIGSGCISTSIALETNVTLSASDISQDALIVAQKNIDLHNVQVKLEQVDTINNSTESYDFIVSNPPYIRSHKDKEGVHHQAHQFEPHVALYLEDSIFDDWFDSLFKTVSSKLTKEGAFFMEGHEDSLEELERTAQKYFKRTELKKDYTNRLRFLYCYK